MNRSKYRLAFHSDQSSNTMLGKFTIALLAASLGIAQSQEISPRAQLPGWAQVRLDEISPRESLEISTRLNPFVLRGDFDGDGSGDLAILVKHTRSKKEGILILLRKNGAFRLVGAGRKFGNGGDDFSWIDDWHVEDRGSLQSSYYEKAVRLNVDGLLVAKSESASALVYMRGGVLTWQQQGD